MARPGPGLSAWLQRETWQPLLRQRQWLNRQRLSLPGAWKRRRVIQPRKVTPPGARLRTPITHPRRGATVDGMECTRCSDDGMAHRLVTLPCGCQDVHYADGTVCYEHQHVKCDGLPLSTAG